MVDLSGIGRGLNTDPIVSAQAAQSVGKSSKAEPKARARAGRGLGLADIPEETPYVPVSNETMLEDIPEAMVEQTEQAEQPEQVEEAGLQALQELDYELVALQALIKKAIARKIELADKHDERKHDLLISAFNDCKNAYQKIEAVRRTLQG